ncbi:hypothetical protein [Sphaerospermopsis sp. LEGE 08334]|jgi:hypothetical protein|uniref:hypothetical protein n=1 Tax=Sphaerospermopsis sp. LEGE 08334 TaxID=1828651 RepID=UPI00187E8747|nr:hypothetical protein [Sphaerospermopsis sp. LEGE 08334]MBE9054450.1 hypothetical protein [Sphaerospermopsis sp. LEGE 08334]
MLLTLSSEFGDITVETNNDEPDIMSELTVKLADEINPDDIEGNAFILDCIKSALWEELSECYGHYGHLINPDAISNSDLIAAVLNLPSFKIVGKIPELDYSNYEPLPDDVES